MIAVKKMLLFRGRNTHVKRRHISPRRISEGRKARKLCNPPPPIRNTPAEIRTMNSINLGTPKLRCF
jgi:hypothetical protein